MALADDWLNTYESDEGAHKSKRWLTAPASDKQLALLGEAGGPFGSSLSRYKAACLITWKFSKSRVQRMILDRPALARAA